MYKKTIGGTAIALALASFAAGAQPKPVDIGFIGTLSTPPAISAKTSATRSCWP